ncbi:MAG: hypothetical protein LRZ85_00460 [Alphaproteobacteria bacterium]|nr:hypothetical protein [Alphaproteobacteria bacterium]MCD8526073.1 hypothetical protein [Alphaproteobacteria bacterium]MCD8570959.1 hypothetical protein [Alphaproteobacteria bacterium]
MSVQLARQLGLIDELEKAMGSEVPSYEGNLLKAWRKALTAIDEALDNNTVLEQETVEDLIFDVVRIYRIFELTCGLSGRIPVDRTAMIQKMVLRELQISNADGIRQTFGDDMTFEEAERLDKSYE